MNKYSVLRRCLRRCQAPNIMLTRSYYNVHHKVPGTIDRNFCWEGIRDMFEWEYLFKPHILDRGWSYAREGAVDHLHIKDGKIEAVVAGNEYYKVLLERKGTTINTAYCSGPYAAEDNYCKHMAAVLYVIDAGDSLIANTSRDSAVTFSGLTEIDDIDSMLPLDKIISDADRSDLESILLDMAQNDERVDSHIRARLSKNHIPVNIKALKWEIDSIFDSYTYKGYIDHHNAYDFAVDLVDYLWNASEHLLMQEKYLELFDLTIHAYVKLGNCDIDDDGEIYRITKTCYDIWMKIITDCPTDIRNSIKSWFVAHSADGTVIDFMEHPLQDFLKYELASEDELREEIVKLDGIIDICKDKSVCKSVYTAFYGYNIEAIELRILLMQRLGATKEDVDRYRKQHMNFRSVREYYLDKARRENNVEREVDLLLKSREMDQGEVHLEHKYTERLIDLYSMQNDLECVKAERLRDLLSYPHSSIEDFRNYRGMCSAEEWETDRDHIIDFQYDTSRKCMLLVEEKLYDRLFDIIMKDKHGEQIKYLNQYGFLLGEDYSEEILAVYQKYVSELASYARNRANYETLIRYLLRMQQYKGGKELVEDLCKNWIEMYPTRKVMVSELSRMLPDGARHQP